jgi:hypothetical protein
MTEKLNLYQKISAITASLGAIQKDSNAPAAMGGYKFLSHAMMLAHLRGELTSRNVVIIPSGEELLKREVIEKKTTDSHDNVKISYTFYSVLKFNFTVVDGDNPIDFFNAYWIGEGMDTSDKGVQKAGTSAEKYFLMKLFKVGDKDDPDTLSVNVESTPKTQSMSATIGKGVEDENEQSGATPAEKPTEVPVAQIPPNGSADDATLKKNQTDALVWFGEQLPPSAGWFKGKIVPQLALWDMKAKKGTLSKEESEPGTAVKWMFNQIAASHHNICGEECPHLSAAQLAVVLGGRITEK